MYLRHLSLANYRNYARLEIDLQARIHVLQGENAQGKTNLLESIFYLATTKAPLASSDRQLISWAANDEVIPFARAQALFVRAGEEHTIETTLVKEQRANSDSEEASFRRQTRLDGVPRRAMDVVGKLNVVLFLPQDIDLVSGSPTRRRRYLDITLCQIDPFYCRSLSRYNRIITQRNALLRHIREGQARVAELDYWDEQLAQLGAYVLLQRLWATRELGRDAGEKQRALTGEREGLVLAYQSSLEKRSPGAELGLCETSEALEKAFGDALQKARSEEIARAVTVVGPHRDDVRFLVNDVDATTFGSRGQQRTIAIALKLAELNFMHQQTGEMPILLLDDVASELDQHRCRFLLETIARAQQVLITTTDLGYYAQKFLDSAVLWRVADGSVAPIK